MKLTLSEIVVRVERRFKLDEPVVVENRGERYEVEEFIVVERTYEYGDTERDYFIRGPVLRADGKPNVNRNVKDVSLAAPTGEFADLMPDPRQPFIDALNAAVDEER